MLTSINEKYLKLRKHTFKSIHKFFESVTDKPVFNEGLIFSDKLENTCVKCPGSPGLANAQAPGRDKIANAPPPGLTTSANAPRLPGMGRGVGEMGTAGID